MSLVNRSLRLADIAEVVNSWEPPRERTIEERGPRRPVFEVIEAGKSDQPRMAKFG
ncbi:hypothetical protein ACU8OS_35350 (plasmid) [Rhizobium leguminosarum]